MMGRGRRHSLTVHVTRHAIMKLSFILQTMRLIIQSENCLSWSNSPVLHGLEEFFPSNLNLTQLLTSRKQAVDVDVCETCTNVDVWDSWNLRVRSESHTGPMHKWGGRMLQTSTRSLISRFVSWISWRPHKRLLEPADLCPASEFFSRLVSWISWRPHKWLLEPAGLCPASEF